MNFTTFLLWLASLMGFSDGSCELGDNPTPAPTQTPDAPVTQSYSRPTSHINNGY